MRKRILPLLTLAAVLLTGCGNAATTCTNYVQAVMDCTYAGRTADYIAYTHAEEAAAQALYTQEVAYVSALVEHQASVNVDYISQETAEQFEQIAQTLLDKAEYRVESAVRTGETFQITVNTAPLDFWDNALPELERVYAKEFAEHFYKTPPAGDAYEALEGKWGERAAEVLLPFAEETAPGEMQSVVVTVSVDESQHYAISEQNWRAIDNVIFGAGA